MVSTEKKELELLLAARVPSKPSLTRGGHGGAVKDDPSIAAAIAELRKHTLSMSKEKRMKLAALFADQSLDDIPPLVVSCQGSAVVREESGTRPITPRDMEVVREVKEVRKRVLERFDSSEGFDEYFAEYITDVGRKRSLRLQQTGARPPLCSGAGSTRVTDHRDNDKKALSRSGAVLERLDSEEDIDAALLGSASSSERSTPGVAVEAFSSQMRLRPLLRSSTTATNGALEPVGEESSDGAFSFYEESDSDSTEAKGSELSFSAVDGAKNSSHAGEARRDQDSHSAGRNAGLASMTSPSREPSRLLSRSKGTKLRLPSLQESAHRQPSRENGNAPEDWHFGEEEEGDEPLVELDSVGTRLDHGTAVREKEEPFALSPALVAQTILQCIDDASDYEFEEYDLDEEYSFSEMESDATIGSETDDSNAGSLRRKKVGEPLLFDDWASLG